MEWLIVNVPLLAREGEDEVMEARVTNLILDNVRKDVIPGASTTEIPSILKGMGIAL